MEADDRCSCTQRHKDPQCAVHGTQQSFHRGMGALPPPELTWQEGRSPTEIVTIGQLLQVRDHLLTLKDDQSRALAQQVAATLAYVKVYA